MDLKSIVLHGSADEASKIVSALKKLPEDTISGISGYSNFSARITSGEEVVRLGDIGSTSQDQISLVIPKGASEISYHYGCFIFNYRGIKNN